ncbi:unnamed protein product, partial [Ectocarpus sp. 4 AP-2014]
AFQLSPSILPRGRAVEAYRPHRPKQRRRQVAIADSRNNVLGSPVELILSGWPTFLRPFSRMMVNGTGCCEESLRTRPPEIIRIDVVVWENKDNPVRARRAGPSLSVNE